MTMKPACTSPVFRYAEIGAFVPSVLLNTLLIAIVCWRKNSELQSYSRILIYNCLVDLLFATFAFVVDMVGKLNLVKALLACENLRHLSLRHLIIA